MRIISPRAFIPTKSRRGCRGLTLIEMIITMAIFGFAMSAMLMAYLFGLKQDQLVQSKLGASDESRRSFERVARDIRCANNHAVGNYDTSSGTFTPIINGTNQVGNAIRIYMTATNASCIVYYFDTNSSPGNWTLNRFHTGDGGPALIASHLQNSCTFSAEDYTGTVQTTMLDKDVIHFTLDFVEYQYPLTKVGNGFYYDRYVMDFRATPHVPGGK
jgi:prepilin-type N-terminal cleavage/methylation domain-containing protein